MGMNYKANELSGVRELIMSKDFYFIKGKGNYDFEVLNEDVHQKNIQLICNGFVKPGQFKDEIAVLKIEGNHYTYDNTIRVDIAGKLVGYLNQDDAKLLTKSLDKDDKHNLIMSCNARIIGDCVFKIIGFAHKNKGMFKKTTFAVQLDLPLTRK